MSDMNANGTPADVNGELIRLQGLVRQLSEENSQLKVKLEEVQMERDDFLSALRFYAPDQVFTREDLEEYRKNSISAEDLFRELEEKVRTWQ